MARKVIDIIYNLVRKRMTLRGDGTGITTGNITSLPSADQVERGMKIIFQKLKDGGLNPVTADKLIKNEDDLARIIEEINQKQMADIKRRKDAAEGIEVVIDKLNRGIPLNPSDQAKIEGAGMKTTLDAFKGFKPKIIQGGKEKIEKSLQKLKDSKKSQKTLKDLLDEYDGDPDAMAGGGLAGALAKLKKKFGKNIIQKGKAPKDKGDKKKTRKMFQDFNKRMDKAGGGLAYMLGEPRQAKSAGGVISKFLKALSRSEPRVGFRSRKDIPLEKFSKLKAPIKSSDMESIPEDQLKKILRTQELGLYGETPDILQAANIVRRFTKEVGGKRVIDYERASDILGIPLKGNETIDDLLRIEFETRPNKADGGRIGFADGGMSRRTFLKIMAALAAFPVVGKLAKTMKVAKGAAPIVTKTDEMPEHFPKLVEKILREGQVVDSQFIKKTGNVKTYRHPDRADIELTIEGEGDRIQLDFDTDQGMKAGYEFRKGDTIEVGPQRGKTVPEFNQGEVKYRMSPDGESYVKDFEEGIETGTENLDEFTGIGKQKTSKSKVNLPESLDDDFAEGGLAGLLGE